MKKYLVLDVETTTSNKGNPFDASNRLMVVGIKIVGVDNPVRKVYNIEHPAGMYSSYNSALREIEKYLQDTELLVGFNLKFDLHWLRRYGVKIPQVPVWDLQIAHHVLVHQGPHPTRYPSLDGVSDLYGNPKKHTYIQDNYWSKGIDSDAIPYQELEQYLLQDLDVTDINLQSQTTDIKRLTDKKKNLILLQGQDLLVLEEMEFNGLPYDTEQSIRKASELSSKVSDIDRMLNDTIKPIIPINYASNDDKSVILYGGVIVQEKREPFVKKDGTISTARMVVKKERYIFPRLVEPPKRSELKKAGYWSTDEGTLSKARAIGKAKRIVELLLERAKLERLNSTYYTGLPALIKNMHWNDHVIHGQLNQCVAITGRLSSDKPNLQNNPEEIDRLFRSRF